MCCRQPQTMQSQPTNCMCGVKKVCEKKKVRCTDGGEQINSSGVLTESVNMGFNGTFEKGCNTVYYDANVFSKTTARALFTFSTLNDVWRLLLYTKWYSKSLYRCLIFKSNWQHCFVNKLEADWKIESSTNLLLYMLWVSGPRSKRAKLAQEC